MRRALLLGIGVLALPMLAASTAPAVGLPCVTSCPGPAAAFVTIPPGAFAMAYHFAPDVVAIATGGTLIIQNDDVGAHNPVSLADAGQCFRYTTDAKGLGVSPLAGSSMGTGDTLYLTFLYDLREGLQVSIDGGPFQACPHAAGSSTTSEAVVPFRCSIHPGLRGDVVVRRA